MIILLISAALTEVALLLQLRSTSSLTAGEKAAAYGWLRRWRKRQEGRVLITPVGQDLEIDPIEELRGIIGESDYEPPPSPPDPPLRTARRRLPRR